MKKDNFLFQCFIYISALLIILSPITVRADSLVCSTVKYVAPSSENNNIVFTFDKPYQCGQFANGDWWVSVDSSQHVTIKSISPDSKNNMNGVELNPSLKDKQGFDSRISGYNSSLNIQLPISIKGSSSIVKAVSVSSQSKCRPCLQYAAVLSVVKSPINNSKNILRPAYYGHEKKYYSITDDMAKKLPSQYSRKYLVSAKEWSFNRISKRFAGVQLDHLQGWGSDYMHPADNMSNYGADIAVDNSVSLLRMMLDDFDINNKLHKSAFINYLQMAVDFQAMAKNGVTWPPNGGHGNGRKLPILFAAYILNNVGFYQTISHSLFSEDHQLYRSTKTGKALFGVKCSPSQYWKEIIYKKNSQRDCRDPYEFIDGGREIGGAYQYCCTAKAWKFTALAVSLLGLKREWKNDAFFEYVERWVTHGAWTKPDPCAGYNGIPSDYNIKFGGEENCILGNGRFINLHGEGKDGGHHGSKFGDKMWLYYKQ